MHLSKLHSSELREASISIESVWQALVKALMKALVRAPGRP
jgi:hypothetical protein